MAPEVRTNIEVRNYDNLRSGLLVGETFSRFAVHTWQSDDVDVSRAITLEEGTADGSTVDHRIFEEFAEGMIDTSADGDTPTLIIPHTSLTSGDNSVVTPRGYLPVLSIETRESLRAAGITYRLSVLPSSGYYYLHLSARPTVPLAIHYILYETDATGAGIWWGDADMEAEWTRPIIAGRELTDDLVTLMDEQHDATDTDFVAHVTGYT